LQIEAGRQVVGAHVHDLPDGQLLRGVDLRHGETRHLGGDRAVEEARGGDRSASARDGQLEGDPLRELRFRRLRDDAKGRSLGATARGGGGVRRGGESRCER